MASTQAKQSDEQFESQGAGPVPEDEEPTGDAQDSEGEMAETLGVSETPETLEKDDIFHVLQNERRRQVLRHLEGVDHTVQMRDVAEKIAAWENDTTVANLHSDQRQRVYIALYQSHLPKLDELGVIEYNQARGTIETTSRIDSITDYLEPNSSDKWDPRSDLKDVLSRSDTQLLSVGIIGAVLIGALAMGPFGGAGIAIGIGVVLLSLLVVSLRNTHPEE